MPVARFTAWIAHTHGGQNKLGVFRLASLFFKGADLALPVVGGSGLPSSTRVTSSSASTSSLSSLASSLALYAPQQATQGDALYAIFKQQINPDPQLTLVTATALTGDSKKSSGRLDTQQDYYTRSRNMLSAALVALRLAAQRDGFHVVGLFLESATTSTVSTTSTTSTTTTTTITKTPPCLRCLLFRDVDAIRQSVLWLSERSRGPEANSNKNKHSRNKGGNGGDHVISITGPTNFEEACRAVLQQLKVDAVSADTYRSAVSGLRATLQVPRNNVRDCAFVSYFFVSGLWLLGR